jgi:uncharacterized protein
VRGGDSKWQLNQLTTVWEIAVSNDELKADFDACDALLCTGSSRGEFISENIERMAIWKAAAESGDAAGQLLYGLCFFYGHGEQKDEETAIQWFLKSAEQANAQAQCSIGLCYHVGMGVEEDDETAIKWFLKSADQGHDEAQYYLGNCFQKGWGVKQSYEKAAEYFTKSADQGLRAAQRRIADYYYWGDGVKKNLKKAFAYYKAAGEQGEPVGLEVLGCSHFGDNNESSVNWGKFGQTDLDKAFEFFQQAADAEPEFIASHRLSFFAQGGSFHLEKCYRQGLGVKRSDQKADEWEARNEEFWKQLDS